jgi:hypothetical protein
MNLHFDIDYFSQAFSLCSMLLQNSIKQNNQTETATAYEAMGKLLYLSEEFLSDEQRHFFIKNTRLYHSLNLEHISHLKHSYRLLISMHLHCSQ